MKKLLVTASTFSHIVNFHLPYLQELHRLGWSVHVACGGERKPIPTADETYELPLEKSFTSPANFKACAMLRRLVRQNRYDLVITHTSLAAFFTRLALFALRPRPTVINVVHGYLFDEKTPKLKALLMKTAEKLTAPVTDYVFTMNRWDTAWAKKNHAARTVRAIPGMGVAPEKLKPGSDGAEFGFAPEDFVLVYSAEFSSRKNQAMLIRALPLLPENVKLLLPGSGELLPDCRKTAEELGVSARVVFPGYMNGVGGALRAADAAVSSARFEGMPFNILEAMLSGLPVIVSRVKGHVDLVQDGETGLLFDYGSEEGFAEAVKKLLSDAELRSTIAQRGRDKALAYTIDSVFHTVMDEYLAAAKAKTGRADRY